MAKKVVIAGSLDTKGEEYHFLRERIEEHGLSTLVVDFGVMGEPGLQPDIGRDEVAAAGGNDIHDLATGDHKDKAMKAMADGLAIIVAQLYAGGELDGIISMGGSGNTSIATAAMRVLPVGVPKVMLSTLGGGDVSAWAGSKDITFMPSIVDIAGINSISRRIYCNAAGAIAGMVLTEVPPQATDKPIITASMFGNTTKAVDRARSQLEKQGFEVLVFHATGSGGRTMESLIADGLVHASLDLTTTELADEVCGGVLSAGPERGMAAAKAGIPTVLVPGCVDMANFWGIESVPEQYLERNLYEWNPTVTLMRTNVAENRQIGSLLAAAANASTGPVAILLPRLGVSQLDSPGRRFWDPQADEACFATIKEAVAAHVAVYEVDHNINDPAFADHCVATLLSLISAS